MPSRLVRSFAASTAAALLFAAHARAIPSGSPSERSTGQIESALVSVPALVVPTTALPIALGEGGKPSLQAGSEIRHRLAAARRVCRVVPRQRVHQVRAVRDCARHRADVVAAPAQVQDPVA